uniref:Pentraxin (PTX) domain-containing protein n=1 Tax=Cyprinodon variegatus TaxID=28743 RepID=A0A3Q2CNL4_CYPVA
MTSVLLYWDLLVKTMVFREQTSSSYVEIVPSKPFNLKAFQLCRKVAINMWRESNGRVNFYVPELWLQQTHLCFTWDSATGATPVFVNGGRSLIKILKKGHRIRPGGRAILDQKPNCFLGTFNSQQSFVGDILDFNIYPFIFFSKKGKLFVNILKCL